MNVKWAATTVLTITLAFTIFGWISPSGNFFSSGYQPVDRSGTVTKAQRRELSSYYSEQLAKDELPSAPLPLRLQPVGDEFHDVVGTRLSAGQASMLQWLQAWRGSAPAQCMHHAVC